MTFCKRFKDVSGAIDDSEYSNQHGRITESEAFETFIGLLRKIEASQGIVYVIGNGGSAGIASHFSNDLMKALKISSQTLYDTNLLTCLANDFGYEHVFSYPLDRLLKPADLLVALSSSGKSPNILNAVHVARAKQANVVTFSGFSYDNPLKKLGDLNFWVKRSHYGLVEIAHFFFLHTIIDLWNTTGIQHAQNVSYSNS